MASVLVFDESSRARVSASSHSSRVNRRDGVNFMGSMKRTKELDLLGSIGRGYFWETTVVSCVSVIFCTCMYIYVCSTE